MYQDLFVKKLRWLDDQVFAELLALGQCLPGPTSTQLSYAIGIYKGGPLAGLVSGLLFMLPGAVMMTAVGMRTQKCPRHGSATVTLWVLMTVFLFTCPDWPTDHDA
jgi:chromate transporter